MNLNPVFVNELRQSLFRRKPLLAVAIWISVTALLVLISRMAPPQYPLSLALLFALPIIVPAFASGAFAKEYEQQTWQELYLTRLSNLQVVMGKFWAALLLSMGTALSFLPAMVLMAQQEWRVDIQPGWWMVVTLWKLTLSACLYVMLAMTCSRYSSNRRTSLVWCYLALSLYALIGWVIWTAVGQEAQRNDAYIAYNNGVQRAPMALSDLIAPGFMGGIHLIFCSVIGLGTLVLLWVSLSEQRGYGGRADEETRRAWQPVARPRSPKQSA